MFDDIFGSDAEYQEMLGATMQPFYWQQQHDAYLAAYYQMVQAQQQQALHRLSEATAGWESENLRYDEAESSLSQQLANLEASLGQQRDQAYADIQSEYGQQKEDIAELSEDARGTQSVQSARQGLLGATVHDSKLAGIDKREGDAYEGLSDWRAGQRRAVDTQYNTSLTQARTDNSNQIRAIAAQRADSDRAFTILKESIFQQYPIQMDPSAQLMADLQQKHATFSPEQYQYMTDPGSEGWGSGLLSTAATAAAGYFGGPLGALAGNALAGWAGDAFSGTPATTSSAAVPSDPLGGWQYEAGLF